MPAVKPAKAMPIVVPTVIATVECVEGSLTKELFARVARRELSILVVEVLAGDVFERAIEDVVVIVLARDLSRRVAKEVVITVA